MASNHPKYHSISEGENMFCQLCESYPECKWKCLDCGLMMCQRCRDKVHSKFVSAEDHTIIDIKEVSAIEADSEPKPDLTRIKCEVHSEQNCYLYCRTCKKLVCLICVAKTHRQHDFDEMQDEHKNRLEKIKKQQKKVEKDVQILRRSKEFLKQLKISRQSYYKNIRQEILDDEKAIIDIVKMHTCELLNELDLNWDSFSKSIEKKENKMEEKLKQSQEQYQGICHLLEPSKVRDVFSDTLYHSLFLSRFSLKHLSTNIHEVPRYIHGDKEELHKRSTQIFGQLRNVYTPYTNDLQVEKQFETGLKDVFSLTACPDGCLWISDSVSKILQKGEPKRGDFYMSVKTNLKKSVLYAAFLHSGDLLLCVEGSSNLKLIASRSTDIQDSVYTVQSLQPVCVHVTNDSKILVIVKIGEKGQIAMMDQKGKQLKRVGHLSFLDLEFYTNMTKTPIFGNDEAPIKVTSNTESTIAVLVSTTEKSYYARVVILNKELEYQNRCKNSCHSMKMIGRNMCVFRPHDISTSPSDNFVVPDQSNHIIHVLNSQGEFITFYDTFKLGILFPRSLSFSATGQLYIGCSTFENCMEKAKIFEVTGFFH